MLDINKLITTLKSKGDFGEGLYELSGSYEYRELKDLLYLMFEEYRKVKQQSERPVLSKVKNHVNFFFQNDDQNPKLGKHIINQIAGELEQGGY